MSARDRGLRYLDGSKVGVPGGTLAGAAVVTDDGRTLGTIEGVVIEPACRAIRGLVLSVRHWWSTRRYIVPLDGVSVAHVDGGTQARIAGLTPGALPEFDASLPRFTDDDFLTALFAQRAA